MEPSVHIMEQGLHHLEQFDLMKQGKMPKSCDTNMKYDRQAPFKLTFNIIDADLQRVAV